MLLLVIPLACLMVIPITRTGARPSKRLHQALAVPWRAAAVLAVANVVILGLTAALFVGLNLAMVSMGILLPMFMGPVLSFWAWTQIGMAMPLGGARRWIAAGSGMTPYLLLALGAWLWTRSIPDGGPGDDTFMAWMGGMMLTAVGLGAAVVGTLVTGLVRSPWHNE